MSSYSLRFSRGQESRDITPSNHPSAFRSAPTLGKLPIKGAISSFLSLELVHILDDSANLPQTRAVDLIAKIFLGIISHVSSFFLKNRLNALDSSFHLFVQDLV